MSCQHLNICKPQEHLAPVHLKESQLPITQALQRQQHLLPRDGSATQHSLTWVSSNQLQMGQLAAPTQHSALMGNHKNVVTLVAGAELGELCQPAPAPAAVLHNTNLPPQAKLQLCNVGISTQGFGRSQFFSNSLILLFAAYGECSLTPSRHTVPLEAHTKF